MAAGDGRCGRSRGDRCGHEPGAKVPAAVDTLR